MSRDRFDVLERFEPLFEAAEPSFERFVRRRDRKRRNQRIAAGAVGIAVFVAAVWILTTGGPSDRTGIPAATGPTGPTGPPDPTGVGLLGFPPKGAPPSIPERGELVLGLGFGHTEGDPGRFALHVYADGRLIWQRLGDFRGGANEPSTGLIEQRLTPEGVELVLAEVLSSGLFDHDRELVGAYDGLHYGGIEVRAGDRLVHLTWGDAGFEQGAEPIATTPTPGQIRAVVQLDERLEDLASWLPASAWEEQEMRAYVPSRYGVCYMGRGEPIERPRILHLLPPPAADMLRPLDTTRGEAAGPRGPIPFWCSVVTTEEAREVAEILEDAGAFLQSREGPSYAFSPSSIGQDVLDIGFEPLLPHGEE